MPSTPKIKAVVVEDDPNEAQHIVEALSGIGVGRIECFSSYEGGTVIESASDADIVSLDTGLHGYTYQSLAVARRLAELNPRSASFFFTANPYGIKRNPFNFTVEKHKLSAEEYGHAALMMLAHNHSLLLLRSLDELMHVGNEAQMLAHLDAVQVEAGKFYESLSAIVERLRTDPDSAHRYNTLRTLIRPALELTPQSEDSAHFLSVIRLPLLRSVADELERLRDISGVHVEPEVVTHVEGLSRRLFAPRAEYVLDELWRGRRASESSSLGGDARIWTKTDSRPGRTVRGDEDILFLNISLWDGKYETSALSVGREVTLEVNIGPRTKRAVARHDAITADQAHLFYSIDFVEVMVVSPGVDVEPLSRKMPMPPGPDATVYFTLTPLWAGDVELIVILLINNDPIHRSSFHYEVQDVARSPEPALVGGDVLQ